jgi:hypothetical protein
MPTRKALKVVLWALAWGTFLALSPVVAKEGDIAPVLSTALTGVKESSVELHDGKLSARWTVLKKKGYLRCELSLVQGGGMREERSRLIALLGLDGRLREVRSEVLRGRELLVMRARVRGKHMDCERWSVLRGKREPSTLERKPWRPALTLELLAFLLPTLPGLPEAGECWTFDPHTLSTTRARWKRHGSRFEIGGQGAPVRVTLDSKGRLASVDLGPGARLKRKP